MSEAERWFVSVRWHKYDDEGTRFEWIELPRPHMPVGKMAVYISSYLREREGLPPDSGEPGERVLWFEWDEIRPESTVRSRLEEDHAMRRADAINDPGLSYRHET